ncbi:STAS domain-containing protein [Sutcliffiella deserti]|uniref:STAS domain-containing protein n=1 Tax=Sutcliffiella deserti TaxID=2875501 RepID=UPI001CC13EDA|nr:STAS domain-containing protein [Sutcliffiella deserti]
MNNKNQELYNFIISNSTQLTDTWIKTKQAPQGTIYSSNVSESVEKRLRAQNKKFISTIASIFNTNDTDAIYGPIQQWAREVAQDRVENHTSISDVISQFKHFRQIYWNKINEFPKHTSLAITSEDILTWSNMFHYAFDTVIEEFIKTYRDSFQTTLTAQQEVINELSSPVISLTKEISVLPLIGLIDTHRSKCILESTIHQCQEKQVEYLVIDLSGVPIVDTMVANEIFQLVATLKLLGVKSVLTGIRPDVAQTTVNLGIEIKDIPTYSSLQKALKHLNFKVVQTL